MYAYLRLTYIHFSMYRQFLGSLLSELLSLPLMILISFTVWTTIFQYLPTLAGQGGMTFEQVMGYYVTVLVIEYISGSVHAVHSNMWHDINSGRLSLHLCRPVHYDLILFSQTIGRTWMRGAVGLLVLFSWGLISGWISNDPLQLLLGSVAIIESICLAFSIQFIIGSITFWTDKVLALRDLLTRVMTFLGGLILPLSFFPAEVQRVLGFLPFRFLYGYPATVMNSEVSGIILTDQLLVVGWTVFFVVVGRFIFKRGLRRYASHGG